MNIEREKEFVHQFHYDARNLAWEEENGTPETALMSNSNSLIKLRI